MMENSSKNSSAKITPAIKKPILIVSRANKALIGKSEAQNILKQLSHNPFSNLPVNIHGSFVEQ